MQKVSDYLNDLEAAKFLRLSPQTLRNWRTQSRGPVYIKAGRAIRYAIEDLRAYMDQNRVNNAN